MKLDKEYIENNKKYLKNILYARCTKDVIIQTKDLNIVKCYKSLIYKFSIKNTNIYLIRERPKVDIDHSIIYEEEEIPIEQYYSKFEIIGDLFKLIEYLEL